MLTILSFVMLAQTQLAPVDVPAIVDAVVAEVNSTLPNPSSGSARPLILDMSATTRAFQQSLVSGKIDPDQATRVPYADLPANAAIQCTRVAEPVPASCVVVDDGLFVAITKAQASTNPGEYQLAVTVRWTATLRSGRQMIGGNNYEMFVAQRGNQWQVVRSRVTRIVN